MDQSQQQHQPARPRTKSTLSFNSNKSRDAPSSPKSSKHERKVSESERRKTHYDPNTKANPNAAMNEMQPVAAALEKPTLQSLRSFQHRDAAGNDIVDPDLSNPTRSRWERPLDTIRSFEAAIDGEYRRRAQSMRADQTDIMSGYNSRRSSYYGGGGHDQNRFSQVSGYYGNRQPMRDSSYDNGHGMGGPVGGPQRMRYGGGSRMQSETGWNSRQNSSNVYPMNGYQQSRDTINTNGSNGSHSDGPYSNEPGSENSSIERGAGPVRPPQDYGYNGHNNGYNNGPIRGEYGQGQANSYFPPQHNGVPPPPPKHATPPGPIKLGAGAGGSPMEAGRPAVLSKNSSNGGDDKRKSWFKRRFSKD